MITNQCKQVNTRFVQRQNHSVKCLCCTWVLVESTTIYIETSSNTFKPRRDSAILIRIKICIILTVAKREQFLPSWFGAIHDRAVPRALVRTVKFWRRQTAILRERTFHGGCSCGGPTIIAGARHTVTRHVTRRYVTLRYVRVSEVTKAPQR